MSLWAESGKWGPQRHPAMTGKPWSVRRHRRVSCCGLVFFVCDALVWCACFCAGIRVAVFVIHALHLRICLFAGIRALLACFKRCPCAGRRVKHEGNTRMPAKRQTHRARARAANTITRRPAQKQAHHTSTSKTNKNLTEGYDKKPPDWRYRHQTEASRPATSCHSAALPT